jgi:hypothetical protein
MFVDFLKLFEAVDMDGSFPMRRYTEHLDSWFKSFKISAQVWGMLSAIVNAVEFAQKLPKFAQRQNFEIPPKIDFFGVLQK